MRRATRRRIASRSACSNSGYSDVAPPTQRPSTPRSSRKSLKSNRAGSRAHRVDRVRPGQAVGRRRDRGRTAPDRCAWRHCAPACTVTEHQAQRELQDARAVGGLDAADAAVVERAHRQAEVDVVQHVERFDPQLRLHLADRGERLLQPEIDAWRSAGRACALRPACRTCRARWRRRRWSRTTRRSSRRAGDRASSSGLPVTSAALAAGAGAGVVDAARHRERQPGLPRPDARRAPSRRRCASSTALPGRPGISHSHEATRRCRRSKFAGPQSNSRS